MEFNFNLEGGNFSRAGAASSEIKKILKQLNVDALLIKRIVVALGREIYRRHHHR